MMMKHIKFLIVPVICVSFVACSSKSNVDIGENQNISRVIYTHKRKNEVVTVKEEKTANEHLIRVNIDRNGEISEAVHQVKEHNFVFEVPLQDAPVGILARKVADYEQYIQKVFYEEIAQHVSTQRFTVTARVSWDASRLDALDSHHDDLKTPSSEVDVRLGSAISRLDVSVLIDQGLPNRYDEFIKQLILAQYFFRPTRGDAFEVKRAIFPAQDFLGNDFQARLLTYEEEVRQHFYQTLSQHIDKDNFEVSSRIFWSLQKLEDLKFQYQKDAKQRQSSQDVQFVTAVDKLQVAVLLDRNLSKENDNFVKSLVSAQADFQKERGDTVNVQRIIFPAKDSFGETHGKKLEQTLQELLANYIAPHNFFVNVQLLPPQEADQAGRPPIRVGIVLNDMLDPKIDSFVKQIIPFTLNTNEEYGDIIEVTRERFPDNPKNSVVEGTATITSTNQKQVQDTFEQIKIYYEQMDYDKALALTKQALIIVSDRDQKVKLLKMKGSLHYLMQEPENARNAWNEVLRIEPNDEEAKQSLNMIES